jgi:hypothetical protein
MEPTLDRINIQGRLTVRVGSACGRTSLEPGEAISQGRPSHD